jgi:hypothetical protein
MSRPGKQCIIGHPKVTGGIDTVDRLPKEWFWSGFRDAHTGLSEEHCHARRDIDSDPLFSHAQSAVAIQTE